MPMNIKMAGATKPFDSPWIRIGQMVYLRLAPTGLTRLPFDLSPLDEHMCVGPTRCFLSGFKWKIPVLGAILSHVSRVAGSAVSLWQPVVREVTL